MKQKKQKPERVCENCAFALIGTTRCVCTCMYVPQTYVYKKATCGYYDPAKKTLWQRILRKIGLR